MAHSLAECPFADSACQADNDMREQPTGEISFACIGFFTLQQGILIKHVVVLRRAGISSV